MSAKTTQSFVQPTTSQATFTSQTPHQTASTNSHSTSNGFKHMLLTYPFAEATNICFDTCPTRTQECHRSQQKPLRALSSQLLVQTTFTSQSPHQTASTSSHSTSNGFKHMLLTYPFTEATNICFNTCPTHTQECHRSQQKPLRALSSQLLVTSLTNQ